MSVMKAKFSKIIRRRKPNFALGQSVYPPNGKIGRVTGFGIQEIRRDDGCWQPIGGILVKVDNTYWNEWQLYPAREKGTR